MWKLSKFLFATLVLYAAVSALGVWWATKPYKPSLQADPATLGFPVEEVEIKSTDGVTLRGWYGRPVDSQAVVVLFHGHRATRSQGLAIARTFVSTGYSVLMVDFRGCGKSDGSTQTFGVKESEDVNSVLRYLKEQKHGLRRIGIVGIGTGASAVILAHEQASQCAAIALLGPYSALDRTIGNRMRARLGASLHPLDTAFEWMLRYRIGRPLESVRPIDLIGKLAPAPVLLAGAMRDSRTPPDEIQELFERAAEPKDLYLAQDITRERLIDLNESLLRPKLVTFFDAELR